MDKIRDIKIKFTPILKRHDVGFAGVFGSYARGEQKRKSDLDLLVKFSKPKSLLDVVGLELDLTDKFGKKVDVITEGALHPYIADDVRKDLKVIYEAA